MKPVNTASIILPLKIEEVGISKIGFAEVSSSLDLQKVLKTNISPETKKQLASTFIKV